MTRAHTWGSGGAVFVTAASLLTFISTLCINTLSVPSRGGDPGVRHTQSTSKKPGPAMQLWGPEQNETAVPPVQTSRTSLGDSRTRGFKPSTGPPDPGSLHACEGHAPVKLALCTPELLGQRLRVPGPRPGREREPRTHGLGRKLPQPGDVGAGS